MEELKLDMMASKEEQLKILVSYLEKAAKQEKGQEDELPITLRTRTLIGRYMWEWLGLYNKKGMATEGAFLYYLKRKGELK